MHNLPLEKSNNPICLFQVSLHTQILAFIIIAQMSTRATLSFETEVELAQIPFACAGSMVFFKLRLKLLILLYEFSG